MADTKKTAAAEVAKKTIVVQQYASAARRPAGLRAGAPGGRDVAPAWPTPGRNHRSPAATRVIGLSVSSCHSERSEESRVLTFQIYLTTSREILRSALNDIPTDNRV